MGLSHATVTEDRVPASHISAQEAWSSVHCRLPLPQGVVLSHRQGWLPGPAPWELRAGEWGPEICLQRELAPRGEGTQSRSSDREGGFKDEVGPVSSGQTPLLPGHCPLRGLLLPAGAQPLWLVPWGCGKSEPRGGGSDGDREVVGGGGRDARLLMPFLPISQPPTCHCRDPQGSLSSFLPMLASSSVP